MPALTGSHRAPSGSLRLRQARPMLEHLESRDAPATLSLDVSYGLGKSVTLSGDLTDTTNPANQTVTIRGVAVGVTQTDSNGHYQITLTAIGLGRVYASISDPLANVPWVDLTDTAPVMTSFEAIEGPGNIWTFRGTLTYHRYFESMTINIGGQPISLQGVTVSADGTGHFEFCRELNGLASDNGTVWAKAVSPWGLVSDMICDLIHQTGT